MVTGRNNWISGRLRILFCGYGEGDFEEGGGGEDVSLKQAPSATIWAIKASSDVQPPLTKPRTVKTGAGFFVSPIGAKET
jgi:hypothetical protein